MATEATRPISLAPDPFERIARVGTSERTMGAALLMALLVHSGAFGYGVTRPFEVRAFAESVRIAAVARARATIDIEEVPPPPPPAEEPPPPPAAPVATPEPLPKAPAVAPPNRDPEPPPSAPAEAGKLLTAEPDPNDLLDLTDQGFVTGPGDRYAGGLTSPSGTATVAVRAIQVRPAGTPGGTGTGNSGSGAVDLSRPAGAIQSGDWGDCGFPPEAEAEQIESARVTLVVVVGPDGRPTSAKAVVDPGNGFGRRAERCAMRKTYTPALDRTGKPAAGPTPPFFVRFTRK